MTIKDKITTSVCNNCLWNVVHYDKFKTVALMTQSIFDARILHESINIKVEVDSDDEAVYVPNELSLKIEPDDTLDCPTYAEIDEKPPKLSPNYPTTYKLRNLNEPVRTIEIVDADVHTIERIDTLPEDDTACLESVFTESIPMPPSSSAQPDQSAAHNDYGEIGFAAGLQLARKKDTINTEPLTRMEVQYERRMQLIYSQMAQLRCGCHNRPYRTLNHLYTHLRYNVQGGIYLPPFTCPACCTTYSRAGFRRHASRTCAWPAYAKMRAVSSERGVSKHRNYQSFKCALCGAACRLLETFVEHVDEHLHYSNATSLKCHCGRRFDAAPAFRLHLLSACVMKPCCDMCNVQFDSSEEFRAHCAEMHDDSDGEQFDYILEGYNILELPFSPSTSSDRLYNNSMVANECVTLATPGYEIEQTEHSQQSADDLSVLTTGLSEEHEISERKVPTHECKLCKREFETVRGLRLHMRRAHANAVVKKDERQPAKYPYKCGKSFCRALIKSRQEWVVHMRMHAENDRDISKSSSTHHFTCNKGCRVFAKKKNLNRHMRSHGGNGSPPKSKTKYYCRVCKTICDSHAAYVEHTQSHLVGGMFADAGEMDAHMHREHRVLRAAQHFNTEKFECELCSRRYATVLALNCHMVWHRVEARKKPVNDGTVDDDDAPRVFENTKQVFRENKLVCTACRVIFPSTSRLRRHVQSAHTSEVRVKNELQLTPVTFKFNCKCGAGYDLRSDLRRHMIDLHPVRVTSGQ